MSDVSDGRGDFDRVSRRAVAGAETSRANRAWWDAEAPDYYLEHGDFLGDADFVWGPEGLREEDAGLLGEVDGRRVLEIGAGAGQCSRWLAGRGAQVVATDLSTGMLAQGARIDRTRQAGDGPPLLACDAIDLPFADDSFDIVFTSYGAVPFVADSARLMREAARVLRPGGRFVFSTTHPIRWAFADDPGQAGLTVVQPYFDRRPYVEEDGAGRALYAEHHRTLGDRIRELVAAGLVLDDLVEPEWTEGTPDWGQWSALRGALIPGTAIFVTHRAS